MQTTTIVCLLRYCRIRCTWQGVTAIRFCCCTGSPQTKDNWTRFAKYLTASYRVVAPDLPGFGDSDKHEDAMYDIGSQVERLAELAKALDLESFHLVGNSMGGHIAAVYAHRYPQQVISLGLFNSSGVTEPQMSEAHQALANGKNLLLVDDVADFARVLAFVFVEQPEIRNALPGPEISGEP